MINLENEIVLHRTAKNVSTQEEYKFIFEPLIYFSIFSFPLTLDEIFEYNQSSKTKEEIKKALDILVAKHLIFNTSKYYQLEENLNQINNRLIGENNYERKKKRIKNVVKLIASFPYVESINLSGSLSKGVWGKETDIDFFIITKKNKLWLCRTLLILFKKIFLFNNKKYFCINYLISDDNLIIPDKNIFTATEISTLQNVYGNSIFELFIKENNWSKSFLPNTIQKESWNIKPFTSIFKKIVENLLSDNFSNKLDTFLLNQTLKQWKNKFGSSNKNNFDLNFRSLKSSSKHHPRGFQNVVLGKYNKGISEYCKK
jgi:flagellin-specific chaperone FliS